MKKIAVVAGGNLSESFLQDIAGHEVVIGADRGAWWLLTYKIIPDFAVGDFDSVSPEELAILKETSPNVVQYDSEKNETDLELAMQLAVSLDPGIVSVYGATGTRFDQMLAGIFMLEKLNTIDITYYDENNEISIVTNTKKVRKSTFPFCSILPVTATAVVTLEGFKYPLQKERLYRYKTRGISNELQEKEATITVHRGKVLCIQSKDNQD